ncbi:Cytochrome oxidase maturation protein, cbb3-type [Flavobacterium daejeonense]|nr:Cytochrome oxidase maturation protein, cbb3-type [Flavobacterium daejeonense]
MSVIYLLITISIFVAIAFLIAFFMAVKSGQYDDDYTPSVRMLFDDETARTQSRNQNAKSVNQNTTTNSEKE